MRFRVILILCIAFLQPALWSQQAATTGARAPLKVTVQGDSNLQTDFIASLEREFGRQGLKLELAPRGSTYDYSIVISQESSMEGAAAAVIALDKNCNFVASVVRSGRLSGKGALNATAKELAKKLGVLERVK
jgi:hypothetical protein